MYSQISEINYKFSLQNYEFIRFVFEIPVRARVTCQYEKINVTYSGRVCNLVLITHNVPLVEATVNKLIQELSKCTKGCPKGLITPLYSPLKTT